MAQDWRYGAAYFEEVLVDHDLSLNIAGWNQCGKMGPCKPLEFDLIQLSVKYDKNGDYIRTWCPELADVPTEDLHKP